MEMMDSPIGVCIVEMHECVIESNKYGEPKHGSWFHSTRHFSITNSLYSPNTSPFLSLNKKGTPIEVTLQAGEFEVVKSILQTSIPYLLGWNATMDLAAAAAISKCVSGGGGQFY